MLEEDVQGYYIHEIQEDLEEFRKDDYDFDDLLSNSNSEEPINQE